MTLNFIINFEEDTMSNQDSKSADLHIINPFTEETYTVVKNHSAAEVNDCVQKSKVAFSQWRTTTGAERAVILDKIAEEILAHKDELSLMETNNCGKPIMESEWDMDDVAACFTYYAKLARELDSKQDQPVDVGSADYECSIRLEPAGVVGKLCSCTSIRFLLINKRLHRPIQLPVVDGCLEILRSIGCRLCCSTETF